MGKSPTTWVCDHIVTIGEPGDLPGWEREGGRGAGGGGGLLRPKNSPNPVTIERQ